MCMYVFGHVLVCAGRCADEGQRSSLGVFLSCSPPWFLGLGLTKWSSDGVKWLVSKSKYPHIPAATALTLGED